MQSCLIFVAILVGLVGCGNPAPTGQTSPQQNQIVDATAKTSTDQTGDGMLPAGVYVGTMTSITTTMQMQYRYSPITGGGMQAVPVITPMVIPAPIGNLVLDGRGNYSLSGIQDQADSPSGGLYNVDTKTRSLTFTSGPLKTYTTTLSFSSEGKPLIRVRAKIPIKNPEPGEELETEVAIDFTGSKGNLKFANTQVDIPAPGVALDESPAPPKVAPPDWKGYTGILLLSGSKTTMRVDLEKKTIDTSLTNVFTDAFPSSRDAPMLLTLYRGNEITLQVVDSKGSELGDQIRVQRYDPLTPLDPAAAISPDGERIAFYCNYTEIVAGKFEVKIHSEVRVCDREGKTVAAHPGMAYPAWTPDGKLLVAGAMGLPGGSYLPESQTGLFIFDTIDGTARQILPGLEPPSKPDVSPDGKRIAFIESGALWVCDIDGKGRRKVLTLVNQSYLHDAAWSPDSKGLAVCYDADSIRSQVDILDLESDKLLRVFDPENRVNIVGRKVVWLPNR